MVDDLQAIIDLTIEVTVFLLVLSILIGGVLFWASRRLVRAKEMGQRLRIPTAARHHRQRTLRLWHRGEVASTTVAEVWEAFSLARVVERYGQRAGWPYGAGSLIALAGGVLVISSIFAGVVSGAPLLGVGVGVALLLVFHIFMTARVSRREQLFEAQLLDALELAARSLRAGHPLIGAFRLVADEMPQPVSTVFGDVCQRHEMGAGLADSLREAARLSPSQDMKMFVTSVAIRVKAGGNLADLMDRLAAVMRERMRLSRRVKVLAAQAQLSKRVLLVLPFLIFVALNLVNPEYIRPLYTTTPGHVMLAIAGGSLALGSLLMNRMSVLRY